MTEIQTTLQQKEKTAQFLWTGFILMFFLIQAIVWIVAISLTANDKSHAVVPNYDERALNWNEEVALRAASKNLGWQSQLSIDDSGDILGQRVITMKLRDRNDKPVDGATVNLRAFHRARAAVPQFLEFSPTGEGTYTSTLRVDKSGHWQFEGQAVAGADVRLIEDRQFLTVSR